MAQDLRAQTRRTCAIALLVLAACGDDGPTPPTPPKPPPIDLGKLQPSAAIEQILETCLGPVRGTLHRSLLQLRGELAVDGATVSLWLPDRMRMDHRERTLLLRGESAWDCPRGGKPRELLDEERDGWRSLRDLLAVATFEPLNTPRAVELVEADRYRVTAVDGATWDLKLVAGSAVPESLTGPPGTVRFLDYTRTSVSWIPKRVELDRLGEHELLFRDSNVLWDELFFADPADRVKGGLPRGEPPEKIVHGRERQPRTPEVLADRARFWLLLDDPGEWEARSRLVQEHFATLQRQRQRLAGFIAFCEENGEQRMMIPFRPRRDGPPFVRPEGWDVRRVPQGQVLVVYPEHGSFEAMVSAGERMLSDELEKGRHRATGPICAQPYMDLQGGAPTERDFAELVVRVSVVIE